jgi:hypothetical protein
VNGVAGDAELGGDRREGLWQILDMSAILDRYLLALPLGCKHRRGFSDHPRASRNLGGRTPLL